MLSNFPLLLAYFIFLGKNNFIKTIYGSWIYSIFIKLTEEISTITDTPLLAAIFCGIICSFGLGLVFFLEILQSEDQILLHKFYIDTYLFL